MSVIQFKDVPKTKYFSINHLGGKGYNLINLLNGGFNVPDGFLITTEAFQQFLNTKEKEENVTEFIKNNLLKLHNDDGTWITEISKVQEISDIISKKMMEIALPEDLEKEILENASEESFYAVRSSGIAEDTKEFSFAGQYDTFLNVNHKELIQSIKNCWSSLFTVRGIIYRATHGFMEISQLESFSGMCVVVQKMVFSEKSGVVFTSNPINNSRSIVYINACFGLGEALVSGKTNADSYTFSKKTNKILEKIIGEKKLSIVHLKEGGTIEKEIEEKLQKEPALKDKEIEELSKTSIKIQEFYKGVDQDIEFGIENDKIYILQSRAITSLFPYPIPIVQSLKDSIENMTEIPKVHDQYYQIYFSLNSAQMFEQPYRPLGWSIFRSFIPKLSEVLMWAGGRVYMDVAPFLNKDRMYKIKDLIPPDVAHNISKLLDDERFNTQTVPISLLSLLPFAFNYTGLGISMGWTYLSGGASGLIDKFEKEGHLMIEKFLAANYEGSDLVEEFLFAKDLTISIVQDIMIYAKITFAPMINIGSVPYQEDLNYTTGVKNSSTEMGLRVGDLSDTAKSSQSIIKKIDKIVNDKLTSKKVLDLFDENDENEKKFKGEIIKFLEDYGHRGQGEIDMTNERWDENPWFIFSNIQMNLKNEIGSHRKKFEESIKRGEKEIERILKKVEEESHKSTWDTLTFGKYSSNEVAKVQEVIRVYRKMLSLREDPKDFLIRGFYKIKKMMQKISSKVPKFFKNEDDIFFLFLNEVEDLLKNPDDFKVEDVTMLIEKRKQEYETNKKLDAPVLILSDGEIPHFPEEFDLKSNEMKGQGVSSGKITGIARVLSKPDEKIETGEILVTSHTDPGWTPLFLQISGLVTEVGGVLTHGSVVAREMGIPAIVGLKNATKIIKTGDKIEIDGKTGILKILSDEFE
jgi:rifampicin phosphotransferase